MEATHSPVIPMNETTELRPFPMDLFISFKDPVRLWNENWFALVLEIASILAVYVAFRHARNRGPESMLLLLTALCTPIGFELLPFIPRPGYLLWWYHQGVINFLKLRLPCYVMCLFAVVHYMAHCATSQTNLPMLTRSLVTSLCAMSMYIPCLWLAPRLLMLLLHFDDPIFQDRVQGIPYMQLVTLTMMFFHTSHLFQQNYDGIEVENRNTFTLVRYAITSGIVAAMYSIVEQYLLYISLHLTMTAGTCVCFAAALAVLAYLAKDELNLHQFKAYTKSGIFTPMLRKEWWAIVTAFACLVAIPLVVHPENLRSNGERLELGPCDVMHEVSNSSPLEVPRRRYVCPNDTAVLNFDFHCIPQLELLYSTKKVSERYTICGVPFENPTQVAKDLAMYSAVCLLLIHTVMSLSFEFKILSKKALDNAKKLE